jgi:hypothetical protein
MGTGLGDARRMQDSRFEIEQGAQIDCGSAVKTAAESQRTADEEVA